MQPSGGPSRYELRRSGQVVERAGDEIRSLLVEGYAALLGQLGIRHKRTRPYRPQTNRKVERLIKTLLAEWACARPYRSNGERLEALPDWLEFSNHRRPHTALDGFTPHQVLVNNVDGNDN